jgi:hypothetical protein
VSHGQRGGSPTVINLSFLDRSRYFLSSSSSYNNIIIIIICEKGVLHPRSDITAVEIRSKLSTEQWSSSVILWRVTLVRTDDLEERIASIIRVTRIGKLGTRIAVTSNIYIMIILCSMSRNI